MGALYVKGRGGIDEDVLRELIKRSRCEFSVSALPRARSWYELEDEGIWICWPRVYRPQNVRNLLGSPSFDRQKYVILGP